MAERRDGCWAWVVMVATLCSQILLGGITLSGGLFYFVFQDAFGTSSVVTSWLCSLPTTMWLLTTPVGSMMVNKYSYRVTMFLGGLTAATAITVGYFATSVVYLFVTHGILTGFGLGLLYTGSMAAVNDYFIRYKTLATGFITIGHNLGLVIYASIIVLLERNYGWRGLMLIVGAVTFHACVAGAIAKPLQTSPLPTSTAKTTNNRKIKKSFINLSVFRKSSFICFCVHNILCNTSLGIYILHVPNYAKLIGMSTPDVSLLLSLYGISNAVGKVIFSSVGQHPRVDVTILYTVSLLFCAICTGLTPFMLTRDGMLASGTLVGLFYCVTGALLGAVIFRIVGHDRFADGVGMSLPFKATGSLIGGPIAGWLFDTTGDYAASFYLAGAAMLMACVIMVHPIIYHHRREQQPMKHRNIFLVQEKLVEQDNTKTSLLSVEKNGINGKV